MENSPLFDKQEFRNGLKGGLPIVIGYWAVGFACGAIGIVSGFSLWQVAALGFFMNAGSAHFLTYSLVVAGGGPLQIAIGVAFINLRYILISLYMAQYFSKYNKVQKFISGLLLTDESFGVSTAYAKKNNLSDLPYPWVIGVSIMGWVNWWIACIAGSLFASQLPVWLKDSLAFSLCGMFIGLVIVAFKGSTTRLIDSLVILSSMLIMCSVHGYLPNHLAILITCILATTIGFACYLASHRRPSSCN